MPYEVLFHYASVTLIFFFFLYWSLQLSLVYFHGRWFCSKQRNRNRCTPHNYILNMAPPSRNFFSPSLSRNGFTFPVPDRQFKMATKKNSPFSFETTETAETFYWRQKQNCWHNNGLTNASNLLLIARVLPNRREIFLPWRNRA